MSKCPMCRFIGNDEAMDAHIEKEHPEFEAYLMRIIEDAIREEIAKKKGKKSAD